MKLLLYLLSEVLLVTKLNLTNWNLLVFVFASDWSAVYLRIVGYVLYIIILLCFKLRPPKTNKKSLQRKSHKNTHVKTGSLWAWLSSWEWAFSGEISILCQIEKFYHLVTGVYKWYTEGSNFFLRNGGQTENQVANLGIY